MAVPRRSADLNRPGALEALIGLAAPDADEPTRAGNRLVVRRVIADHTDTG